MPEPPLPATTSSPMLQAVAVYKEYSGAVRALDAVDLSVSAGETLALIGASGCGKTTLLRLFNRMVEPTRGHVSVRGAQVTALDPVNLRRSVGYVQQNGGLIPHWSVARNVSLVPSLLSWSAEKIQLRVDSLLNLVGLDPTRFAHRYPLQLSGGERQRVAVARALAADPDIVLLDEPFGALDALTRREVQQEFRTLKERLGKTLLLVTHDLDEAFLLGDRIAVMERGRILQCATPAELQAQPAHPYVEQLLSLRPGAWS